MTINRAEQYASKLREIELVKTINKLSAYDKIVAEIADSIINRVDNVLKEDNFSGDTIKVDSDPEYLTIHLSELANKEFRRENFENYSFLGELMNNVNNKLKSSGIEIKDMDS